MPSGVVVTRDGEKTHSETKTENKATPSADWYKQGELVSVLPSEFNKKNKSYKQNTHTLLTC